MRIALLAAAAVVAGCGESDADRAALANVEREIRLSMRALSLEDGKPPRHIRADCHKDGDRVFHCEYGFDSDTGGDCLRYTATARGTITARHEYRLDGPVSGRSINGSLDPCPSAR
jgi:hypothetical protein